MDSSSDADDVPPEAVAIIAAHAEQCDSALPEQGRQEAKLELSACPIPVPVPVTVITGYLGSGKTSLVKYILTERHGYRIAVILNEFGEEVGIESAFVQDSEGGRQQVGEWVELANGCLCCSVKDNFLVALEGLVGRRDQFDHVLVETTGLANPGPIMSALWTDKELEAGVLLDSVVAVVDACHISRQLAEGRAGGGANEAQLQIAYADLVLLNKTDVASSEQQEAALAHIRGINTTVEVIACHHSRVDLARLLGRRHYSGPEAAALLLHLQLPGDHDSCPPSCSEPGHDHDHQHDHRSAAAPDAHDDAAHHCGPPQHNNSSSSCSTHAATPHPHQPGAAAAAAAAASGPHPGADTQPADTSNGSHKGAGTRSQAGRGMWHDEAVTSVSLRVPGTLHLDRLKEWVEGLLWERQEGAADVLRMKGVLNIAGSSSAHMLQAVYELYEVHPGPSWDALAAAASGSSAAAATGNQHLSRVVVIGRRLDRQQLEHGVLQCVVVERHEGATVQATSDAG